ncbi:hypothetical protein RB195_014090 [Necator americanus]|uniref:Uncharacterized protein n=1 Tax=Necator americanus TaxID=51031 RepID=A0ABR1DYK4_NECAM
MQLDNRNRGLPIQQFAVAGLKDEECRTKFANICLFMLEYGGGRSSAMRIRSQFASGMLQGKHFRFYCHEMLLHLRKQKPHILRLHRQLQKDRKRVDVKSEEEQE